MGEATTVDRSEAITAKIGRGTTRHTGGVQSTPSERARRFVGAAPSGMSVTEMLKKTLEERPVGVLVGEDDTATAPPPRPPLSDPALEAKAQQLEIDEACLVAERAALQAEFDRNESIRKRYAQQQRQRLERA